MTLYHAVGPDLHYRLGALLLDLENPVRVLHRSPDWLIQPEEAYELEGYYRGVIFPCGKVVIDGTLFIMVAQTSMLDWRLAIWASCWIIF